MKSGRFFLVFAFAAISWSTWAQGTTASMHRLNFYEKLAQRDAEYEQNLGTSYAEQDELDYWNDQRDFERQLGKSNFTYYLVYMKSKKQAHREHLEMCGNSCSHSQVYWNKMREYLSVPDSTDVFEIYPSKLVLSTHLKKRHK
nr:hypothetical protein [Allomuricauda sp.]